MVEAKAVVASGTKATEEVMGAANSSSNSSQAASMVAVTPVHKPKDMETSIAKELPTVSQFINIMQFGYSLSRLISFSLATVSQLIDIMQL